MSAPACATCGRPASWRVERQAGGKKVAHACRRHLQSTCWELHPDPARHQELTVTRADAAFWDPVARPFPKVSPDGPTDVS